LFRAAASPRVSRRPQPGPQATDANRNPAKISPLQPKTATAPGRNEFFPFGPRPGQLNNRMELKPIALPSRRNQIRREIA
jgi:hypothetical protein